MPVDPKVNSENPPKPGQHIVAPSGNFHNPSALPQPMIDPYSGKVLVSAEGPQNTAPK